MRADGVNPREALLRLCAAAAPEPWYPRAYAKSVGVPLDELLPDLEYLWQEGLVRKAVAPGEPLPGLAVSEAGTRALDDPETLERVRRGLPVAGRDRAAAARRAAAGVDRPLVNRALVLLNLLAFGYSVWLAHNANAVGAFLAGAGDKAVLAVLHAGGAVRATDIVRGETWRLLAAAFVHAGLLHLLMNMGLLVQAGPYAEAAWGRWRYLLIYLAAAVGGCCAALAHHAGAVQVPGPDGPVDHFLPVLGASGAVCGVLAALAVWVYFNGRYLPRSQDRVLRASLLAALAVLAFLSLFPGVSGWGHLGGALAGGAAALLLHFQRWGRTPWRWLGLAGAAAVPVLALAVLDRARASDPRWHAAERQVYEDQFRGRVTEAVQTSTLLDGRTEEILQEPPRKRDPNRIEQALPAVERQRLELEALGAELTRAGPFHGAAELSREDDCDRVDRLARRLAYSERLLRANANTPDQDEREEHEFDRLFSNRTHQEVRRALAYYQSAPRTLLGQPAGGRDVNAVMKALQELRARRHELAALGKELSEAGPYGNEVVERARQGGGRYAGAAAALLDAAERALRTDGDLAAVNEPERHAQEARRGWEELLTR
jgi:membrane associated rhomboid family serine protease